MEEGNFRTRRNALGLSSVEEFKHVKGGWRNGCKDVQFLRIVGSNGSMAKEIGDMDRTLAEQMELGQGFYNRKNSLPRLASPEDAEFYSGAYEKWACSKTQGISLKTAIQDQQVSYIISKACVEILALLGQGKQGMNQSIEKNFMVKVLFWLDETIAPALQAWEPGRSMKAVFSDICKPQEYLFCYLLTLLGMDVLLLQAKQDISPELERLGLSRKCVAGNLGQFDVPEYQPGKFQGRGSMSGNMSGAYCNNRLHTENLANAVGTEPHTGAVHHVVDTRVPERDRRTKEMLESRRGGRAAAQQGQPFPSNGRASQAQPFPSNGRASQAQPSSSNGRASQGQPFPGNGRPSHGQSLQAGRAAGQTQPFPADGRESLQSNWEASQAQLSTSPRRELAYEELAQLASSVVQIMVHDERGNILGGGSGIMVGRAGYILTNNHVACRGRYYSVRIEDDEKAYQTDEMIKYNSVLDLAVLRIDRPLQPLPIYDGQKKLVRGQRVVAIGSPLGLFNSVSDGIISGFRTVEDVDMIQFTAPISNGSSGGAVLNMYGEVIGISTAGFDAGQNINLAVGYGYIRDFVRGFTG